MILLVCRVLLSGPCYILLSCGLGWGTPLRIADMVPTHQTKKPPGRSRGLKPRTTSGLVERVSQQIPRLDLKQPIRRRVWCSGRPVRKRPSGQGRAVADGNGGQAYALYFADPALSRFNSSPTPTVIVQTVTPKQCVSRDSWLREQILTSTAHRWHPAFGLNIRPSRIYL